MKIHPTAIIDPQAELHESVNVGPYSVIEADVVIGEGTIISGHARIFSKVRIGKNNKISHGVVLGCLPQHLQFNPETRTNLIIGDNNVFREYVNISLASKPETPTRLGDHNYFMGQVHIGHDVSFKDHNIIVQSTIIAGHSQIGSYVFISGLVGIHQFTKIGDYAIIGGCAKVVQDIPPFVMADGNPAWITGLNLLGLRRANFPRERVQVIKDTFRALYRSGKPKSQVLKELSSINLPEDASYMIRFFEESERGVMGFKAPDGKS